MCNQKVAFFESEAFVYNITSTTASPTYVLVAVDAVIPGEPFFVSATASHLDPLAIALDAVRRCPTGVATKRVCSSRPPIASRNTGSLRDRETSKLRLSARVAQTDTGRGG